MSTEVDIIVVVVTAIVDAPSSDVSVEFFMDALAGVMLAVLTGIDIEVMPEVNANAFAVAITALELPVSTTLEEFSR